MAGQERVKIERSAAELIARAAAGGMRDALSLLDQAIAYAGDEISLAQVQAMLGVADPRAVQKLITAVAELDSAAVLHFIHELSEAGADLRQLNMQVGEYWRALMLTKAGADIATILDRTEDEAREIRRVAQFFDLEELTETARIFAQNELMQKGQGTPQLGLELAFLQSIELHRRSRQSQFTVPMTADAALHARSASAQARSTASQLVAAAPVAPENVLPTSAGQGGGEATGSIESKPSLTLEQVRDAWDNVKKRVRPKNPKTAAMLNSFAVIGVEGTADETVVVIQAAYELHHKYVQEGERAKDVDWALSTEFKQKCRVRLLAPGATRQSSPVFESGGFSPNAAVDETPPLMARRERPAANSRPRFAEPEAGVEFPQDRQERAAAIAPGDLPAREQSSPVVKKNFVRENTTTESIRPSQPSLSSLDIAKQKASGDPVVKEVIKTFQAKIVDIRLK